MSPNTTIIISHEYGNSSTPTVRREQSAFISIDAGADSIEHASKATDAQLQEMKQKGIFLVATDINDRAGPPEYKDRLQRAMKAGVKIAVGSDLWIPPLPGKTYGQMALLDVQAVHDEGMSNIDAIRSATLNAAELMGWSDLMGQIAAGKLADLIAVSTDPLQDIEALQHVRFVMKGSTVVRNDFASAQLPVFPPPS